MSVITYQGDVGSVLLSVSGDCEVGMNRMVRCNAYGSNSVRVLRRVSPESLNGKGGRDGMGWVEDFPVCRLGLRGRERERGGCLPSMSQFVVLGVVQLDER